MKHVLLTVVFLGIACVAMAHELLSTNGNLPAEEVADPYANIPVFQTPTSDVLAKQEI